ncbi:MAG: hypothetical protein V1913_08225 [Fibrobacterota bacterium]
MRGVHEACKNSTINGTRRPVHFTVFYYFYTYAGYVIVAALTVWLLSGKAESPITMVMIAVLNWLAMVASRVIYLKLWDPDYLKSAMTDSTAEQRRKFIILEYVWSVAGVSALICFMLFCLKYLIFP